MSAPASLACRRLTTDAKPIFLMAGIDSADVAPAHATVVSSRLKLRTPFSSSVVTCWAWSCGKRGYERHRNRENECALHEFLLEGLEP